MPSRPQTLPHGLIAGLFIAVLLMLPLFIAIFMDVDSSRTSGTPEVEINFPGSEK